MKRCNTCCRPADAPFRRRYADGTIEHGCIDAAHDGHLTGDDAAWHDRPVSIAMRADWRAFIQRAS